jgi:hypothetical protein
MLPCKRKLDEEKSKYAYLAQQNGFRPCIFAHDAEADRRHCKA